MRVTLATHGGLAAAVRANLPPEVLDTDTLPENAADELSRLVAAAIPAAEETKEPHSRARDAMSYSITVEEGGRSSVLVQSDTAMTPEFAMLLRWLKKHSTQQ
ncbi:protealysin inhibitor emfourin [Streptomyces sp. NPDC002911]